MIADRRRTRAFALTDLVAVVAVLLIALPVLLCALNGGRRAIASPPVGADGLTASTQDEAGEQGAATTPATGEAVLGGVRSAARRATCASNLRGLGTAPFGFSAMREGRFPGRAHSLIEKAPVTWQDLLNREWYHNNAARAYPKNKDDRDTNPGPVIRYWEPNVNPKKWLLCPSMQPYEFPGRRGIRPYAMNLNACGGPDWDKNPFQGPYGKLLGTPQTIHPNYDKYALGARLEQFTAPASRFLLCESEDMQDEMTYRPPCMPSGGVYLGDSPASPPWSGQSGQYAFRHGGPPAGKKEGDVPTANFLFLDGHVAAMPYDDRINVPERFAPK